jgi:hypothetical protein
VVVYVDDVEGSGRLVGQDQRRLAHQSHGNHNALTQAAEELVGVLLDSTGSGRYADSLQELNHSLVCLAARYPFVAF